MQRLPKTLFVALLFATSLAGCGLFDLDNSSEQILDLIDRNRSTWESSGIEDYSFSYNETIGDEATEDIYVVVRGGQIDSAAVADEPAQDPSVFLTIDGIYNRLEDAYEREDRGSFQVDFNEELGYPERYRVGAGNSTEGEGVVVTSFEVDGGAEGG